MEKYIVIRGAKQHNLKNIDLKVPRDKLIVFTGISGSGKSSLAFDTIYAEGQRRYVESLSAYARQFLNVLEKPDVEYIDGIPPTISIEQRTGHATPRSTVATSTEIYDYLRILYARIGDVFCINCKTPITQQTTQQIVDNIMLLPSTTRLVVMSPIVRGKKGTHRDALEKIKKQGYVRARIDDKFHDLYSIPSLNRNSQHDIDIVIDRLTVTKENRIRIAEAIELAVSLSEGTVCCRWESNGGWEEKIFSQKYACIKCSFSITEMQPRLFSFNSPYGACQVCDGLGTRLEIDIDLVIPDKNLSLAKGAVDAFRRLGHRMVSRYDYKLREFAYRFHVPYDMPYKDIPSDKKQLLLYGTNPDDEAYFEGVIPHLMKRFNETESVFIKRRITNFMGEQHCKGCGGTRLRKEAQCIKIGEKTITELTAMTVENALLFYQNLKLTKEKQMIAKLALKEIISRLQFLSDVGLSYLTLDRKSETLSGGEAQRIRLASQLGSGLVGVCYCLDEPTIGLHPVDNKRLLCSLTKLRDIGNTVLIVEHDEDTILASDWVVEIGPGAGRNGGEVVYNNSFVSFKDQKDSITSDYLFGRRSIQVPQKRRQSGRSLIVKGASENNLKNIDVEIPLNCFVAITGVSGSGKSTLVYEILYKGLNKIINKSKIRPGKYKEILNHHFIKNVVLIDQDPIGRTPRSNPATYTGIYSEIRNFFAQIKESRARGYSPGRFSFNTRKGRCNACDGLGVKIIEMHFLPDVYVTCEVCNGARFNKETLEINYKGKNISDILNMSVDEALELFGSFPKVYNSLKLLIDVGLGYMKLGQSSTTLSGGEAQRVKLAYELGRSQWSNKLFLLDEPTTGLHFYDVDKLLKVLHKLVDLGNSVVVIEHNMHVIKTADFIVDLGPEGGDRGGQIVASDLPDVISTNLKSSTGQILKNYLNSKQAVLV
ncbi:MAG: excinuclease ABC subunit UvrA [Planctomycetes bacterium]|nr:excinuclease ABC subunit UvrA [Planctomycetota bacterium]